MFKKNERQIKVDYRHMNPKTNRKNLKVVFMSGYPRNTFSEEDILEDESKFVQKPIERKELISTINKLLK